MAKSLAPLPLYPSTRARASLTPSQSATLHQTISGALLQVLSLSDSQVPTPATVAFVTSYVKDVAQQSLHSLVWGTEDPSTKLAQAERKIRHAVFLLAERLAPLGTLDLQTLVDLSVAYARISPSRLRALFAAAFVQAPKSAALAEELQTSAVPAFTVLLASTAQGLYGLRKTTHILLCLLRPTPAEVLRAFARNKAFMRALANAYHAGLAAVAQTYGGLRNLSTSLAAGAGQERELDEWERLFLETKVALLDTFHILVRTLLDDVASIAGAGPALAAQAEPAFEVVFGLLDLPAQGGVDGLFPIPFLNRSLLADYQHAYDFSRTLADVLRRTEDARADLLESSLHAMSADVTSGSRAPGALKLILRSSGVPPGVDNLGRSPAGKTPLTGDAKGKGKGKDLGLRLGVGDRGVPDEQVGIAVAQVLDLLPDQDPRYVRYLLSHNDYPYRGDAERLIGALLEGTAPSLTDVQAVMARQDTDTGATVAQATKADEFAFTRERRNVFDDEVMDLSKVKIGRKSDDADTLLEDRTFIEQMKADILRRAEEVSESEEEDNVEGRGKGKAMAFEEELDDEEVVRVRDGDASDEGEEESDAEDAGGTKTPRDPEIVLELAYIQDPKQFDRDGQTRRGKARADLKAQTGYTDEQIEGWRIMLERDPKRKQKMMAKHEFAGNKSLNAPIAGSSQSSSRDEGSSSGRGHSRGRGRGRGRGGGHGGGGGGGPQHEGGSGNGDIARDRAHKARRANHARKRGHDKKMARMGGPS